MRPGQQNKRGRGRGNNNNNSGGNANFNRKGGNPLARSYDSSGPDVKIRGTAQHIAEKYAALARDAQGAGDRIMAENYLQHAEHYNRIIAAAQAQMQDRYQRDERSEVQEREAGFTDADDIDGVEIADDPASMPQPVIAREQAQPVRDDRPQDTARAEAGDGQNGETGRQGGRRRERRQPQRARGAAAEAAEETAAQPAGPAETSEIAGGDQAQVVAVVDAASAPQPDVELPLPADAETAAPRERRRRAAPRRRADAAENGDNAVAAVEVAAE